MKWNETNEKNGGSVLDLRIGRELAIVIEFCSFEDKPLLIRRDRVLTSVEEGLQFHDGYGLERKTLVTNPSLKTDGG